MPTSDERRARRLWIASHHPDRGGDTAGFVAGLASFAGRSVEVVDQRLTVVRTTGPVRSARRTWRRLVVARRRHTHHGSIR